MSHLCLSEFDMGSNISPVAGFCSLPQNGHVRNEGEQYVPETIGTGTTR